MLLQSTPVDQFRQGSRRFLGLDPERRLECRIKVKP